MNSILQMTEAQNGVITEEMMYCAECENLDVELIRQKIADGRVIILKNNKTSKKPLAIGDNLRTKICAAICNFENPSIDNELDKIRIAQHAKADIILNFSNKNQIQEIRSEILLNTKIPIGSALIFENESEISKDNIFSKIEQDLKSGADFISVPCAFTKASFEQLKSQDNIMGIVHPIAKAFANSMDFSKEQNPLYQNFDELLDLLKEYDAVLSISKALSTGCIADSNPKAQIIETVVAGELIKKAHEKNIQTMIEYSGHTPFDKIYPIIKTIKDLTFDVPIFTFGPAVLDSSIGHNDIACAMGAVQAAICGANMIACINIEECTDTKCKKTGDIRDSIIAGIIAAQSADISKGNKEALKANLSVSLAKTQNDIKRQIDNAIDKCAFDGVFKN